MFKKEENRRKGGREEGKGEEKKSHGFVLKRNLFGTFYKWNGPYDEIPSYMPNHVIFPMVNKFFKSLPTRLSVLLIPVSTSQHGIG